MADNVALRSPNSPGKTSVQCRHKMEKLRKRYRNEIQRFASSVGRNRYNSSWVHFGRMDCMEKGPTAVALPVNKTSIEDDEDDEEEDEDDDDDVGFYPKNVKNGYGLNGNGGNVCSWNRIASRGNVNLVSPTPLTMYNKFDGYSTPKASDGPKFGGFKDGFVGKFGMGKNGKERLERKESSDPAGELVGAIKALGDGFLRMERMKMDMVREVEAMRMDMEVKKTEMFLESQQRILESFVNAVSEGKNKEVKRMRSST